VKYACGKCERSFEAAELVQPAGGGPMICRECAEFLKPPAPPPAPPPPAPGIKPVAETCRVCGRAIGVLDDVVPGILERIHVECAEVERRKVEAAQRAEAEREVRARLSAGDNGPLLDELRAGRAEAEATREAVRSMRAWVVFFGVVVILGLIVGVIWALAKA